ncbi:MAG: hypothetical protein H7A33_00075 [Deltaproteobacteria bacterium]|nr:hypothetical protein [Deltaproteobacteria bacterium]
MDISKGISVVSLPALEESKPSELFRQRFNEVSEELKYGLKWVSDDSNYLRVDLNEIEIAEGHKLTYLAYGDKGDEALSEKLLTKNIKAVLLEVESQRQKKVQESYESVEFSPRVVSLDDYVEQGTINADEAMVIMIMQDEFVPLINEIYAWTQNSDHKQIADFIEQHGTDIEKQIHERTKEATCVGIPALVPGADACNLVPYYPDKPPINGLIASGISLSEFSEMKAEQGVQADLSRPNTYVSKTQTGEVISRHLPKHPALLALHQQAADVLDKMAAYGIDPLVADQFKKWAIYFREGTNEAEEVAVQASIDAGSSERNLRVHFGPSESYWPDNTKYPYLLQVGIVDRKIKAQLLESADRFLQIEEGIGKLSAYDDRDLSLRGGFADPMVQVLTAGFVDSFPVPPAGNNFPNYPYPNVEGSNRLVLMDVIANANLEEVKAKYGRLFNEDPEKWNDYYLMMARFSAIHESGHLLGPQRSHITPSGKQMGILFDQHWGSAEEPKADLINAVDILYMDNPSREEKEFALRALAARITSSMYPGKAKLIPNEQGQVGAKDHIFGVGLIFSYCFNQGSIKAHGEGDEIYFQIDYDQFAVDCQKLADIITNYQAEGDLEHFMEFTSKIAATVPDEVDQFLLNFHEKGSYKLPRRSVTWSGI